MKQIKNANGYYNCEGCRVRGKYVDEVVYDSIEEPTRMDEGFIYTPDDRDLLGISLQIASNVEVIIPLLPDCLRLALRSWLEAVLKKETRSFRFDEGEILARGDTRVSRDLLESWFTGPQSINKCNDLPLPYWVLRLRLGGVTSPAGAHK